MGAGMFGIGKLSRRINELNDTISEIGHLLCAQLGAVTDALDRIADADEAQVWYTAGRPTGIRSLTIDNQEIGGMTISNVTVELLPAKVTAVAQIVTVSVEGFQTAEIPVPASETAAKFAVPPGSTVSLTVASRDAAGNTSAPFVVAPFVALDTEAPDSPDGIGAVRANDTEVVEPGFVELLPA